MTVRALLILPALCVPAWYAGRQSAARPAAAAATLSSPSLPVEQQTTLPEGDEWDSLSKQAPTPENRWRALTLFEQWVKTGPAAAAARLAALPEEGCRLWPKRGALEAFCKVWATHDPDSAWQAVQSDPLKSQRDTVAAFRARAHAQETATDKSLSDDVRNMARCRLAEENPAAGRDAEFLFGDALVSAMLRTGNGTPFAHWRELRELEKSDHEYSRALDRVALISKDTALAIWQEGTRLGEQEGGGEAFQGIAMEPLAFSATNGEELKAITPGTDQLGIWKRVMTTWDDAALHRVLQQAPGSGENDLHLLSCAAGEMLGRDPMALLPYLSQWSGADLAERVCSTYIRPNGTAGQAAQLRALIEAAPPAWQKQIAAASQEVLEEYDPAFLLGQVERQQQSPDKTEGTVRDDGAISLSPSGVFNRWLQSDAAAAMTWMNDHPSLIKPDSLQDSAKEWVARDPEAASAWMNTLPAGPQRDFAIRGLVEVMQTYDPAAASAWAARVTDPAGRKELQDQVIKQWQQWNPNARPVEP